MPTLSHERFRTADATRTLGFLPTIVNIARFYLRDLLSSLMVVVGK